MFFLCYAGFPLQVNPHSPKKWVDADPTNRVRINRDSVREQLTGDATNHTREKEVTALQAQLQRAALAAGKDVVDDNTNLNGNFLPKTILAAQNAGATVQYKDFPVTLEEALRRNSQRDRKVPENVIRQMFTRLGPEGQFPVFPGSYPVKTFQAPATRKLAVAFDMDGTANNVSRLRHWIDKENRRHRDFDAFHRLSEFEPAHDNVIDMMWDAHEAGFAVLITTARSEPYRETTQKWLDDRLAPYENIYMRRANDFRPDYVVKKEMFGYIKQHYDLVRCVDDNPQAVQAWEECGVTVSKVPFNQPVGVPFTLDNPFRQSGVCVRCGKSFKGDGFLGPTCKLR